MDSSLVIIILNLEVWVMFDKIVISVTNSVLQSYRSIVMRLVSRTVSTWHLKEM